MADRDHTIFKSASNMSSYGAVSGRNRESLLLSDAAGRSEGYGDPWEAWMRSRHARHNGTGSIPYSSPHELIQLHTAADGSGSDASDEEELYERLIDTGGGAGAQEQLGRNYMRDSKKLHRRFLAELKSNFFGFGLISGASLQMFAVSIVLMFASYSHNAGSLVELR